MDTPYRAAVIRAMRVQDLEEILRIEVASYSHPWSRGNFQDSLLAGHPTQVLQAGDGHLVGYSVAMPGVDEVHLLNLTVARDCRGRGHGRLLLMALVQQAREQHAQAVWLEVRSGNRAALALYRGFGFEQVGLRRDYYPSHQGREDAVLMTLALSRATAGS